MKEPYMEIKYLKYDKNTDWLAYQRKLPRALLIIEWAKEQMLASWDKITETKGLARVKVDLP